MPADGDPDDPASTADREPDYRFTLANERTFLAWIRTALAVIAGGVALAQLVPRLGVRGVRHLLSMVLVAVLLVVLLITSPPPNG